MSLSRMVFMTNSRHEFLLFFFTMENKPLFSVINAWLTHWQILFWVHKTFYNFHYLLMGRASLACISLPVDLCRNFFISKNGVLGIFYLAYFLLYINSKGCFYPWFIEGCVNKSFFFLSLSLLLEKKNEVEN